jgi:hypothetical protein
MYAYVVTHLLDNNPSIKRHVFPNCTDKLLNMMTMIFYCSSSYQSLLQIITMVSRDVRHVDAVSDEQSNFLPVPTKKSHPVPTYQTQILQYISNHFRDAHPEAFKKDVESLTAMRRDWVEAKADIHPEIVKGLMRYVTQEERGQS